MLHSGQVLVNHTTDSKWTVELLELFRTNCRALRTRVFQNHLRKVLHALAVLPQRIGPTVPHRYRMKRTESCAVFVPFSTLLFLSSLFYVPYSLPIFYFLKCSRKENTHIWVTKHEYDLHQTQKDPLRVQTYITYKKCSNYRTYPKNFRVLPLPNWTLHLNKLISGNEGSRTTGIENLQRCRRVEGRSFETRENECHLRSLESRDMGGESVNPQIFRPISFTSSTVHKIKITQSATPLRSLSCDLCNVHCAHLLLA